MKIWSKTLLTTSVALISLSGCNPLEDLEEPTDIVFESTYAIPLVTGDLSINHILENTENNDRVITLADGLLAINLNSSNSSFHQSDFISSIPDFSFPLVNNENEVPFTIQEGMAINSLEIKNGTLDFEAHTGINEPVLIIITFNSIKKNGAPLVIETTAPAYNGSAFSFSAPSLNEYVVETENGNISISYEAKKISNNTDVAIQGIIGNANNWEYSYLDGIFESQSKETSLDSIEIDLLDRGFEGNFYLEDPVFQLNINSSLGFPAKVNILHLEMSNEYGESVAISGSIMETGFDCAAPNINQVGESVQSVGILNQSNSNIREMLSINPTKMTYKFEVIINPDNSNQLLFVTDNSEINFSADAIFSAHGRAILSKADTVALDFEKPEEVKKVVAKLATTNEIPLAAQAQMYFIDNNIVTDSLFDTRVDILAAAQATSDISVTSPTSFNTEVILEGDKLERFLATDSMISKIYLMTTENGATPVKIYGHQKLTVDLSASVTIAQE